MLQPQVPTVQSLVLTEDLASCDSQVDAETTRRPQTSGALDATAAQARAARSPSSSMRRCRKRRSAAVGASSRARR